ncbi:MAG: hypothetical protein DRG78_13735 [Epsilonproteobacteria bacterium]|nr:MAG: hypothetical protein DRG78_13735 [Campylobacterota bacterium]
MDNEIKGYYRNILDFHELSTSDHTILELILVDEDTLDKLADIFSIAKKDNVNISILTVIGYNGDSHTATGNANNIEEKINSISTVFIDNPLILYGVTDSDNINIQQGYYGKIVYSLNVQAPNNIPVDASNCWQVTLGENVNLLKPIANTIRLISLELGKGKFIQYSNEDCGTTQLNEREFIYFTIGGGYGLKTNPPPGTKFMTHIQKIISDVGVNINLTSNAFEINDVKLDGGFVTSGQHKLGDFGDALLINCIVALSGSVATEAKAITSSLIIIVIPVHDDDGIHGEVVGTIIAGEAGGVTFDTEISADMSLSLTAGFIHLITSNTDEVIGD